RRRGLRRLGNPRAAHLPRRTTAALRRRAHPRARERSSRHRRHQPAAASRADPPHHGRLRLRYPRRDPLPTDPAVAAGGAARGTCVGRCGLARGPAGLSSNSSGTTPSAPHVTSTAAPVTTPTQPTSSGPSRFLEAAGPTEVSSSSAEAFGTGLGTIAGTAFPNSVRQLYGECCATSRSETFSVPEGFTHFQASIGLETGGTYAARSSPTILYEVD